MHVVGQLFANMSIGANGGRWPLAWPGGHIAGLGATLYCHHGLLAICSAIASLLLSSASVQAQTTLLTGRITDSQGAALPGVTVTAGAPTVAAPTVVTTDATGTYRFATLEPGVYIVVFSLSGFQTERRAGVSVPAGESSTLDMQLVVARRTERVDVVGVTPLLGADIGRDRVPATVAVLGARELQRRGAVSIADALNERLGAVTLEDGTTNPFQPTLRFRGFTASPVLGLPQGIAVYQNGVRINEPFGDTVQFDLLPQFAISQAQLSAGANPTFGLNALGGALALRLKNGFDFTGVRGELSGGSFERFTGTAEYGANRGPWALYVGTTRFDETGWRVDSPSEVTQAVADVGYRRGPVDGGVTVTYADTSLNGNGPAPVELLAVDRSAVFTFPDTTENRLAFVQSRFALAASDTWRLEVTGYYRDLDRRTLNGDEAEFGVCHSGSLPDRAPDDTLCLPTGDAGEDVEPAGLRAPLDRQAEAVDPAGQEPDNLNEQPLVDARDPSRFITATDALGDGAFNRTDTRAQGYGATVEATATHALGERDNVLILGASSDLADVAFDSNSEVGTLTPDRTVAGSGLFAGIFGEAPDDRFSTDLDTESRGFGLYVSDTLSLTDRAHVSLSGRFNWARITLLDRLGTSLNGDHAFSRFNPGIGAVVQASNGVSVFARYTESNRAPTAAELSCADPQEPCRVPNAFVSDPPLEQAVARSVEGGARGDWLVQNATLEWSASMYRTRISDDILFVASPQRIGTGFFQNAGDTQRVGLDVDLRGQLDAVGWYASYGLVQATFDSPLELPGNTGVNDATNEEGTIVVDLGDRLPGIPRHSFKTGVRIGISDAWEVALDTIVSSNRIFLGDEGNDQIPLDGFGVASLRSSYRATEAVELFVRVNNLFDTEYATFGALAELELDLAEVPDADDPRFVAPGAPRSGFAGVRVSF